MYDNIFILNLFYYLNCNTTPISGDHISQIFLIIVDLISLSVLDYATMRDAVFFQ